MEPNPGRDPPKGKNVLLCWSVLSVVSFLGVAFCLPGEDPLRAAIWAGAASAVAGLALASWWAVGYVAPSTENESGRKPLALKWEIPFAVGAVVSACSWFFIAPAYSQGRSPFEPWWCFIGIGGFTAAGIVVDIMRGRGEGKRILAVVICMVLWAGLMLIGQHAMNTGLERPLIGILLGAAFFVVVFKPWLKD